MSSALEAPGNEISLQRHRKEVKVVEAVLFIAAITMWLGFAIAVVGSQSSIGDLWDWFQERSLLLQIPLGIVFLPWVIGMWVWQSSLPFAARSLFVAGVAWANLYSVYPWKAG